MNTPLLSRVRSLLTAALVVTIAPSFAQAPGDLDPGFADAGRFIHDFGAQDNLTRVCVQPADQKIVAVGTALTPEFAGRLIVVRLLPNGTLDPDFNGTGIFTLTSFTESYAYDCVVRDDGKLVVTGSAADPNYRFSMITLRFNADGTLDDTFGTDGIAVNTLASGDAHAYAMTELPDHRLVLAGLVTDAEFRSVPAMVRLSEDGVLDPTFGTDGLATIPVIEADNSFTGLVRQGDGRLVAAGHYDFGLTADGQFDHDVLLARFTAEGELDPAFGTDGTVIQGISDEYVDAALGIAEDPNTQDLLVCGYTTLNDFGFDAVLLRYDADGAPVTSFGDTGLVTLGLAAQDVATAVAVQPDGRVLIAGTSGGFFFDDRDQLLVRYLTNGDPDTSFGTNGIVLTTINTAFDEANALALQADGKIVVAGKGNNGSNNDITVLRHFWEDASAITELGASAPAVLFPSVLRGGDEGTVVLNTSSYGQARSVLFDAGGREVARVSGDLERGRLRFTVPTSVGAGAYTLRVMSGNAVLGQARLMVSGR